MKKLMHIVESAATGTLAVVMALCRGQVSQYELIVAYGVRPDTPTDIEAQFHEISPDIKMVRIDSFTRNIQPAKDVAAWRALRGLIIREKPQLVHLHSSKAGAIGRLLLLSPTVRSIIPRRTDGSFCMYYTPHGYGFLQQDCGRLHRAVYKLAEFVCGHFGANTIACSEWEYTATAGLTRHRYYVNNGIDTAQLDRLLQMQEAGDARSSGYGGTHYDVYLAGRITGARNPALFQEIAMACDQLQFLWIGDGEDRALLQAPNITVTGYVSHEEAVQLAMQADIFLLPSLWEGLSISLLEAMYLKKVCIVSDIVQNRAVITDGVDGYLCSTVDTYIKKIHDVCGCEEKKLTENARARVCSGYTEAGMIAGYGQIYEEEEGTRQ